jgi:hypothetical protein
MHQSDDFINRVQRIMRLVGELLTETAELMSTASARGSRESAAAPAAEDRGEQDPAGAPELRPAEEGTQAPGGPAAESPAEASADISPAEAPEAAPAGRRADATEPGRPSQPEIGAADDFAKIKESLDEEFSHLFGDAQAAPTLPEQNSGSEPLRFGLHVVCTTLQGKRLAIPWQWVSDTLLSEAGVPEAFSLSDHGQEMRLRVAQVHGVWTTTELSERKDPARRLTQLDELIDSPGAPAGSAPSSSAAAQSASSDPAPPSEEDPSAGEPAPSASTPSPPPAERKRPAAENSAAVWVVSPSALARRFLTRHLDELGIRTQEARDLDDPRLAADLEQAGALFLDETLLDQWQVHPLARRVRLPIVHLTVDGPLQVPTTDGRERREAVLPRPFERSEVSAIVTWLRDWWAGAPARRAAPRGSEEDDTWLFADPFGSSAAGGHSSRS